MVAYFSFFPSARLVTSFFLTARKKITGLMEKHTNLTLSLVQAFKPEASRKSPLFWEGCLGRQITSNFFKLTPFMLFYEDGFLISMRRPDMNAKQWVGAGGGP